jgi:3D (Asp-Asp-Asp) domain-containing protein
MTRKFVKFKKNMCIAIAVAGAVASAGTLVHHQHEVDMQHKKEIQELKQQNEELKAQFEEVQATLNGTQENIQVAHERLERLQEEVSRGAERTMDMYVTAYDLSPQSCGKDPDHPGYGITATGVDLSGHTLESARAIAVDPNVIPLGSKVKIKFKDEDMAQYNGIYTAVDTGGAIKGNTIDLFAGEDAYDLCMSIGNRRAKVQIL